MSNIWDVVRRLFLLVEQSRKCSNTKSVHLDRIDSTSSHVMSLARVYLAVICNTCLLTAGSSASPL
jgi:hypothetical protein